MPCGLGPYHMTAEETTETPLEAARGSAGPQVTETFKLLSDETRLAILLALWESYDPRDTDNTLSFSDLYDRVGVRDSGNFTYHLNKLTDHFIEEINNGYKLRNAGLKMVQAVIAGRGLQETRLAATEVALTCYRCNAPVEIRYEAEHLYHICTECVGNTGSTFAGERPVGTLMKFDFDPSGLANRTPEEVFVACSVVSLREFGLLVRGLCPECSGPVEDSLHICEAHHMSPGEVCPNCGTRDEIRVGYVCSVCKHGDSYPVHAAIYDHPAVVGFCHEHGIENTYDLADATACSRLWDNLLAREYALVSEEPVRIRITIPGDGEQLELTLDRDLGVIDVCTRADDCSDVQ